MRRRRPGLGRRVPFLSSHDRTQYGQLAAFCILYSLPAAVLHVVLGPRLGGGFALGGALKG